jgi:hypothetical protein
MGSLVNMQSTVGSMKSRGKDDSRGVTVKPEPLHAAAFTPREAALRYAEDSVFASEFEQALYEIYVEHVETLKRIQRRLGKAGERQANGAPVLAMTAKLLPGAEASGSITPERVRKVIGASAAIGLTRGDIASRLGIDSRDIRLTRVLRALKVDRLVRQTGSRRAARYHVVARVVARQEASH